VFVSWWVNCRCARERGRGREGERERRGQRCVERDARDVLVILLHSDIVESRGGKQRVVAYKLHAEVQVQCQRSGGGDGGGERAIDNAGRASPALAERGRWGVPASRHAARMFR